MILSDKTILRYLKDGVLGIAPLEQEQIQPASADIRLGDTLSIVDDLPTGILTLDHETTYRTIRPISSSPGTVCAGLHHGVF